MVKKYRMAFGAYILAFLVLAYLLKTIIPMGSNTLRMTLILVNSVTVLAVSIVMSYRQGIDVVHTIIMALIYIISINVLFDSSALSYLYFYIIIDFIGIPMARVLKSFQSS